MAQTIQLAAKGFALLLVLKVSKVPLGLKFEYLTLSTAYTVLIWVMQRRHRWLR